MTTIHPEYDPFFNKLCDLLIDGEDFDADILTDTEFLNRIQELSAYIPTVRRDYKKESSIRAVLHKLFASGQSIDHHLDPDKYNELLDLWVSAMADGFLPDSVCKTGPCPNKAWVDVPVTPVKPQGKRTVTPGPKGLLSVSAPVTSPPSNPTVSFSAAGQPPLHPSAIPPANPSSSQVQQALLDFLQGGTVGSPLPRSPHTGTPPPPDLPPLSAPPSEWLAPAYQKVYDLASFLPSSGTAKPKISTPGEWISAAHQLGQAMSASPEVHNFKWSDFICYIELTTILFAHYDFTAVLEHDIAWRKWRRAYNKLWCASNPFLRDVHLLGHNRPAKPADNPSKPKSAPPGGVLLCFNFSGPGCFRQVCRYLHKCRRCNTTFPNTVTVCPCVNGVFPPGTSLPPGVTFGK